MIRRPKCPACGSHDISLPGFVSFHWAGGRWRPQRGTEEIADGAPMHCQGCGATLTCGDINRPDDDIVIDRERLAMQNHSETE